MSKDDRFIQGIVAALDVVAIYDAGTIFRDIVESADVNAVLKEIEKNGLERTKLLAKTEIIDRKKRRIICE